MSAELVLALARVNLVLTPIIVALLMARPWVRRRLGVHAALGLWAMIPLAAFGAFMPVDPATGPMRAAEGMAAVGRHGFSRMAGPTSCWRLG